MELDLVLRIRILDLDSQIKRTHGSRYKCQNINRKLQKKSLGLNSSKKRDYPNFPYLYKVH